MKYMVISPEKQMRFFKLENAEKEYARFKDAKMMTESTVIDGDEVFASYSLIKGKGIYK